MAPSRATASRSAMLCVALLLCAVVGPIQANRIGPHSKRAASVAGGSRHKLNVAESLDKSESLRPVESARQTKSKEDTTESITVRIVTSTSTVTTAVVKGVSKKHVHWTDAKSLDVALDFKKVQKPGKDWRHGNVAVVRYNGTLRAAVRLSTFERAEKLPGYKNAVHGRFIHWWRNAVQMCNLHPDTLLPLNCTPYDPRGWTECLWNDGYEATGIEDPRLIPWPGIGLFMMFGSKPPAKDVKKKDMTCQGPWRFAPYLTLLERETPANKAQLDDGWAVGKVVQLSFPLSNSSKEKNWNPFVHEGQLYFSQSYHPHVVLKAGPDGKCPVAHVTNSTDIFGWSSDIPRGNTNTLLIPREVSGENASFYLGIVHFRRRSKPVFYRSFFYKMKAEPPFEIYKLSMDIPLIQSVVPSRPWLTAAFPLSLELLPESARVMIGYGSGDHVPRVKVLAWDEVDKLFRLGQPTAKATAVVRQKKASSKRHVLL